MLETMLMFDGKPQPAVGELKLLTVSGTRPTGWEPYTSASIIDRTNNRIVTISSSNGNITNFDLLTNTWGSPINGGAMVLTYGTRGVEAYNGTAYVKWGASNGSYVAKAMALTDNAFTAANGWSNTMYYLNQILVGNTWYLFGGRYGYSVDGANTMAVRTFSGVNIGTHGTTNPTEFQLRFNATLGTDGTDIYVFGGNTSASTGAALTNEILKYTIATKTWSKLPTVTGFSVGGGAMAPYYKGKFYFVGNSTTQGSVDNGWIWTYTVATGLFEKWIYFPELTIYRQGLVFIYNDLLYYFCPYKNNAGGVPDIYTISLT